MKGIETGYALDPSDNCGKDCKVCYKWNEQYRRTPEMFQNPVIKWHLNLDLEKEEKPIAKPKGR